MLAETRLGYRRIRNRLEWCLQMSKGWRNFNARLTLVSSGDPNKVSKIKKVDLRYSLKKLLGIIVAHMVGGVRIQVKTGEKWGMYV